MTSYYDHRNENPTTGSGSYQYPPAHGAVSEDGNWIFDAARQQWLPTQQGSGYAAFAPVPSKRGLGSKAKLAIAAGGTALLALGLVGVANLRAPDAPELPDCTGTSDASCIFDTLDAKGIWYNDSQGSSDMDDLGDSMCALRESGVSDTRLRKLAYDSADWTQDEAATVTDLILDTYCPGDDI